IYCFIIRVAKMKRTILHPLLILLLSSWVGVAYGVVNPLSACIFALASSGNQGITSHGAPMANLNGCSIISNTSMRCTGHNLNAAEGDAHTTNKGCGVMQFTGIPVQPDPYSALSANIPPDPCPGLYPLNPYPQEPNLPLINQYNGAVSLPSGNTVICGDLQLTGNTTITTPGGSAALVIFNGQLDLNGFTLQTMASSGLTVVFTGANNATFQHIPSGLGTLDIAAPASGPWSGISIYQDPFLRTNVDISDAGSTPTWNLSGVVYLPHSSVRLSGAVNHSTNGTSCFQLVVDNITINGNGGIFACP
ncbi:MAG: hypothetical protein ACHQJ6_02415, partial [Candidatus Berkiellales bacterium]